MRVFKSRLAICMIFAAAPAAAALRPTDVEETKCSAAIDMGVEQMVDPSKPGESISQQEARLLAEGSEYSRFQVALMRSQYRFDATTTTRALYVTSADIATLDMARRGETAHWDTLVKNARSSAETDQVLEDLLARITDCWEKFPQYRGN